MKKSNSHTLSKSHQPVNEEENRLAYYPHTLPPHCKPHPLPRKSSHVELRKTVSSQTRETLYDRPTPRPRHVHRDTPIPLPRQSSAVKQSQICTPVHKDHEYTGHEYTEVQPPALHGVVAPHMRCNTHHSPPLTLKELAHNPHNLPATIETIDGYLGFGHQFTISTGDMLCVHFVKHTKMVSMCDRVGALFYVPLSSAIKFGLCREKTEPEEYVKVSDIVKQRKSIPHVICCQQYIPGHEAVEEGEVLIVKGYKQLGSKAGLTCHSLKMDKEILLPKNCRGSFTTAPEKTSMYLLDIVDHLANLFPFKVCLYPPFEHNCKNHDLFTRGRIFTMKECTIVTSLVVSNINSTNSELFDIVLDDDLSQLRVSIVYTAPETIVKQTFPPGHYTQLIKSEFTSHFQQSLYTTLRPELVTKGVDIAHSSSTAEGSSNHEYEYVEIHPRKYYSDDYSMRYSKTLAEENRDYLKSLSVDEVRPICSL